MAQRIFDRLQASGRLPTAPGVVVRLLEISRDPTVSMTEIADTIAMDTRLAGKLMRFANSPMAGLSREITSLTDAVSFIGIRPVMMMTLSFTVVSNGENIKCPGFDSDHFAIHSIGCGTAAKAIAEAIGYPAPQEAFLAGLLSQLGRSVYASGAPDEYAEVLAKASAESEDLLEVEKATFGESYASLGAQLLRSWNIPEVICDAVATFRDIDATPSERGLAGVLNAAEIAAFVVCPRANGPAVLPAHFASEMERRFSIGAERCAECLHATAEQTAMMQEIVELPAGRILSHEQLEEQIGEQIAELSMAMHIENRALAERQKELLQQATTDGLTGVGNRMAFDARLALELERIVRTGESLALLMVDVDRFKLFNDTHGHQAADRVLQVVARALEDNVRKVDYVARYGGDEFTVIAPCNSPEGLQPLAERLRQAVSQSTVTWEGRPLRITVSIGAALCISSTGEADAARLIKQADERLYAAKCAGRNCVAFSVDGVPTGLIPHRAAV